MTAKGTGLRPAIIQTLSQSSEGLTTAQLAERLGTQQKYARKLMLELKEDGIVSARRDNRQHVYSLVTP